MRKRLSPDMERLLKSAEALLQLYGPILDAPQMPDVDRALFLALEAAMLPFERHGSPRTVNVEKVLYRPTPKGSIKNATQEIPDWELPHPPV